MSSNTFATIEFRRNNVVLLGYMLEDGKFQFYINGHIIFDSLSDMWEYYCEHH